MADRLPSGLPDVDADVVTVGAAVGLDALANLGHERPNGRLPWRAEREEVGFVGAGDDQRVIARQRETIREGGGQGIGGDELVAAGVLAHDASHRA
jgi:hypothetical protein